MSEFQEQFTKYEMIKSMHTIVTALNNEEAYMKWIYIVPDEADEDDLKDIAEDEELFELTVKCFKGIMKHYLKDGLYINNKLY